MEKKREIISLKIFGLEGKLRDRKARERGFLTFSPTKEARRRNSPMRDWWCQTGLLVTKRVNLKRGERRGGK